MLLSDTIYLQNPLSVRPGPVFFQLSFQGLQYWMLDRDHCTGSSQCVASQADSSSTRVPYTTLRSHSTSLGLKQTVADASNAYT